MVIGTAAAPSTAIDRVLVVPAAGTGLIVKGAAAPLERVATTALLPLTVTPVGIFSPAAAVPPTSRLDRRPPRAEARLSTPLLSLEATTRPFRAVWSMAVCSAATSELESA